MLKKLLAALFMYLLSAIPSLSQSKSLTFKDIMQFKQIKQSVGIEIETVVDIHKDN